MGNSLSNTQFKSFSEASDGMRHLVFFDLFVTLLIIRTFSVFPFSFSYFRFFGDRQHARTCRLPCDFVFLYLKVSFHLANGALFFFPPLLIPLLKSRYIKLQRIPLSPQRSLSLLKSTRITARHSSSLDASSALKNPRHIIERVDEPTPHH